MKYLGKQLKESLLISARNPQILHKFTLGLQEEILWWADLCFHLENRKQHIFCFKTFNLGPEFKIWTFHWNDCCIWDSEINQKETLYIKRCKSKGQNGDQSRISMQKSAFRAGLSGKRHGHHSGINSTWHIQEQWEQNRVALKQPQSFQIEINKFCIHFNKFLKN